MRRPVVEPVLLGADPCCSALPPAGSRSPVASAFLRRCLQGQNDVMDEPPGQWRPPRKTQASQAADTTGKGRGGWGWGGRNIRLRLEREGSPMPKIIEPLVAICRRCSINWELHLLGGVPHRHHCIRTGLKFPGDKSESGLVDQLWSPRPRHLPAEAPRVCWLQAPGVLC